MKLSRATPEMLLLLAVALLLAPGIASLIRTPYGLSPSQFWLAAFYVGAIAWAALARCVRVLGTSHAAPQSSIRNGVLVVLLGVAFVLAMVLPSGLLVAAYNLFGAFPGGSGWVLFNKYVGHLVSSAASGYLWLISLCLVTAAIGLAVARSPVQRSGSGA